MDGLLHDLRSGVRTLRKSPGFAATVVLTLALGIGANTAIFTVVATVLLGSLPFDDAGRIVHVGGVEEGGVFETLPQSAADYLDYREQSTAFSAMTLYTTNARFTVTDGDRPEEIRGLAVSDGFFEVFGLDAVEGRVFRPQEDVAGNDDVVVLSHGLWRRRFGGDPGVVGSRMVLSGRPHTVVGVLRPGLEAFDRELLVPLALTEEQWANRRSHFLQAFGRLAPGVTLETAQAELAGITARLERAYPETNGGRGINLTPLRERMVGPVGPALWLLQGSVGLVLLIVCANVAGLVLVRSLERGRETAIRAALGAGRLRLARQVVTESAVLAAAGGVLGVLLAVRGVDLLVRLIPPDFNLAAFGEIAVDYRVLAFAVAVTLATGVLFGLLPALKVSRARPAAALKAGGDRGGTGRNRAGAGLVMVQVALGFVLLVGAGLLTRSFGRVLEVDPGFAAGNVLTLQITRPPSSEPDFERTRGRFWSGLEERVAALPGVEAAGVAQVLPLQSNWTNGFVIEGGPDWPEGKPPEVEWRTVGPGYFNALDIPLLRGRTFDRRDRFDAPAVAIVDDAFARRYFAGAEALGRRLKINPEVDGQPWLEIVGVVGSVRHEGATSEPRITVYQTVAQAPQRTMQLAVRTRGEPMAALPAVLAELRDLDPGQPVARVTTLAESLRRTVWPWRFSSTVLGLFAGLALLLAAAGVYGVLTYSVGRRTREIGVRMALGARRGDIVRSVVSRGMALVTVGAALGLLGALGLTRLLGGLLYGVGPFDPATWASILAVLFAAALLAAWLPARWASRVDPLTALRSD